MTWHLNWNGVDKFYDLGTKECKTYYKHIEIFYRLQRFNERHRYKNFKLIPKFHHGCLHIQYDSQAIYGTLKKLKLVKKPNISAEERKKNNWERDYYQKHQDELWKPFFKIPETKKKKFRGSIKTDGVAISFSMCNENAQTNNDISEDGKRTFSLFWLHSN